MFESSERTANHCLTWLQRHEEDKESRHLNVSGAESLESELQHSQLKQFSGNWRRRNLILTKKNSRILVKNMNH